MKTSELYATALEIRILAAITAKTARRALERRADLARAGISVLQFGIMRALCWKEQTISELSHRFMLDPSTLVPAVDALERKAFVRRGKDPNDRRRIPLSLTEPGAEFISCAPFADDEDPLVKSLSTMGDEQAHHLMALLRHLVRHMPEGEEILRRVSSRVRLQRDHDAAPSE